MYLKSIRLQNYKNILELDLELNPGLTLIVAPNGSGKTNLLEAIDYLSAQESFRELPDSEITPLGNAAAHSVIAAVVASSESDKRIAFGYLKNKKSWFLDAKKTTSKNVRSSVSTLVYSPDSVDLLSNSAAVRRDFLDSVLSKLTFTFANTSKQFKHTLVQKNRLLKMFANSYVSREELITQLNFWNEKIIEYGSYIAFKRIELLEAIRPELNRLLKSSFQSIPGLQEVQYEFISKYLPEDQSHEAIRSALAEKILAGEEKEMLVGNSLYGPQRDDVAFILKGRNIKLHASRGQQRLFSLLVYLAIAEYYKQLHGQFPILLLDDVFSELDHLHRDLLLEELRAVCARDSRIQVLITSPLAEQFEKMGDREHIRVVTDLHPELANLVS